MDIKNKFITDVKYNVLIHIIIIWIISSILFYFYVSKRYGIPPIYGQIDWDRYKDGALSVLNLKLPDFPARYYLSYCIYLALSISLKFPIFSLFLNLFLNLISAILIFRISEFLFNKTSALICIILFLFYPFVQMWVFFIQPVSFFSFSIILLTYAVVKTNKINQNYLLIFISALLTLLARPHGISFIISLFIFLIIKNKLNHKINLIIYFLYLVFLSIYINYLGNGNIIPIFESWRMEDLKQFGYSLPVINDQSLKICLNLSDKELNYFSRENSPTTSLNFWACSFFNNPIDVLKIFLFRIYVSLSFYKPVFSFAHNIFSFLTLIPIYLFFLFSLIKFYNQKINFIFISILLILFSSCVTIVDGDNRVFSAVLPIIFIVSSGGIGFFLKKYFNYLKFNKSI